MLDHTHRVFVQRKSEEVFGGVDEVRKHVLYRESFQHLLDEMCRVVVSTKFVKLLSDLKDDQGEFFVDGEVRDKSLKGMSSLLVFDKIAETW
jgi:hypothetical protein